MPRHPQKAVEMERKRKLAGVSQLVVLSLLATAAAAQMAKPRAPASARPQDQIGYKSAADAEQKKTLLLKDFKPASMLHAASHKVDRAKYYVIDVHNHVNDAQGIDDHMPPQRVIEVMDKTNVKTVVILTGMWGEKLQKVIDEMVKPYPGRFIVFTQIDWSKIDDPNFSAEMVQQLRDAVGRGARGLKLLKDLGLGVRDKSGKFIAVDDPRLDPVWEECGRLGIPVSIHTADPEAFFHPIDATNERYEELIEHPDWSFYGPQFPSMEQLLEARNRVFARHPRTTFVSLHMGWPENLDWVAGMLDKYPNVMAEFGAREAELGRQPRRTRELFLKYQDRIMFGTDNGMEEAMYRNHFRWLETADEYFDYWGSPGQGRWEIYGLNLPDPVLEKVYHLNAERMFHQFKGLSALKETK
jgi:predicted TIM-barrel fold metal-dependent hydrolase